MSNKQNRSAFLNSLLICFSLCFLEFLYGPTQIYISNAHDFSFNISDIWHYMFPLAALSALSSTVMLFAVMKVSKLLYRLCVALTCAVFVAMLIQGNLLTEGLPLLDGNIIDWNSNTLMRILSVTVWSLCVFGAVIILKKVKRKESVFSTYLAGFGLLFLTISLILSCLENRPAIEKKNESYMTAEGFFELSENENFIVFLLDSLNETAFEEALSSNQEYNNIFRDFTAYTNTMCMYPYTNRSVPYILFGKLYDNSLYYRDYLNRAVCESPLLKKLKEEKYDVRVYSDILQASDVSNDDFQNFIDMTRMKNPVKFCKMLLKLTALRYAPYDLKRFCLLSQEDIYFDTLKTDDGNENDYYSSNNADLYNRIKDFNIVLVDHNCYRFIYADGAHVPWRYDGKMNEIEDGTYKDGMECSLFLAEKYIEKLKNAGVYDNSVIIFLSDHGVNLANPMGQENKQHSVMLIKGINEHHSLIMNDAPISHADLQEAYIRLLNGKNSLEVFEWKEGEERTRTYLYTDAGIEADLIEFESAGHARNMAALKPTGRTFHYSGGDF